MDKVFRWFREYSAPELQQKEYEKRLHELEEIYAKARPLFSLTMDEIRRAMNTNSSNQLYAFPK